MQLAQLGRRIALLSLLSLFVLHGSLAQASQNGSACPQTCLNGGKCLQEYNSDAYACDCTGTGFTGPACANKTQGSPFLSTVAPAPFTAAVTTGCPVACQNGQCTQQLNSDAYTCKCNPGYSGVSCANKTAAALPSSSQISSCPVPCQNGKCTQQYNSDVYTCQCNPGYTGVSCSNQTAASSPSSLQTSTCPVACKNGKCTQEFNSNAYTCQCDSGYSGVGCSQEKLNVSKVAPAAATSTSACPVTCQHGMCTQQYNSDSYWCQCSLGWTGIACNVSSTANGSPAAIGVSRPPSTGGFAGWKIFIVVLVGVVGLVGVGAAGIILWKRRQTSTFVRYNDSTFEPQQVEVLGKQHFGSEAL